DDSPWTTLFEKMFDPTRLAVPFYAILGNHDYKEGKDQIELDHARRHTESRFKLPARWYRAELPPVTLLALDGNHREIGRSQWLAERQWLESELSKKPPSDWTVCFAHQPLFSDSHHGDEKILQDDWGPIFKRHHVDFYLAGHDHCLEHLQIPGWPTSFVVSGGGGQDKYEIKRHD